MVGVLIGLDIEILPGREILDEGKYELEVMTRD
jgi:hypothetical protein